MENADLGLQYCSIFSVDIPPDFQILTTVVGQIPVGVVGADGGQGLRRFWAKSDFWVQTLPAQSAVQTPLGPFPWAWSDHQCHHYFGLLTL